MTVELTIDEETNDQKDFSNSVHSRLKGNESAQHRKLADGSDQQVVDIEKQLRGSNENRQRDMLTIVIALAITH
jgi:hypothetical protein